LLAAVIRKKKKKKMCKLWGRKAIFEDRR